jgi:hypothetical protein
MFNSMTRLLLLLSMGALVVTGCSEAAKKTPPVARPVAKEPAKPVLDSGVPQTPEAAVLAVVDGLKANHPVAFWDAIPRSHRKVAEESVRSLAGTIDQEVWDRTVANLKKLLHLAETKKDWILDNPLVKGNKQFKIEDLKASWEPWVAFLKTVVDSELVDRQRMQHFDGRAFFDGTGAKLYAQARAISHLMNDDFLKRLDGVKTTVEQKSPTEAVLTVELPPNPHKRDFKLIIAEGQWTADLFRFLDLVARGGTGRVAQLFKPYTVLEWRDKYLKDMERLGKTIDALEAAKTADEFREVMALRVITLGGQIMADFRGMGRELAPWEVLSRGRTKEQAILVVDGQHDGDEPDIFAITKVLRAYTQGKPASFLSGPDRIGAVTVYMVSPVSDIKALANEIKVGKITQVDVKRNLLKIKVATVPNPDKAAADASSGSKGT